MINSDRTERAHGFPSEFRVETALDEAFSNPRIIFESGVNFTDPGRHPVWVPCERHQARFVRVVATRLRGGFFGLSELFVFSGDRNLALGAKVIALDRYETNLNWNPAYLTDGFTPLGLPILAGLNRGGIYTSASLSDEFDPSWIEVELPKEVPLSSLTLVPAFSLPNLSGLRQLGEGFPLAFRVEARVGDGLWLCVFEHVPHERNPFPNPSNLALYLPIPAGLSADRVRITATRHAYRESSKSYHFALAEVELLDDRGVNVALHAAVQCSHPTTEKRGRPAEALVDGFSSEGALMPLREWLKALDRRRVVLHEISDVEKTLEQQTQRWSRIREGLGWGTGVLFLGVGGFYFWHQRGLRRRHSDQLREQIAQDLHDEVGSTLGSISLYADALSHQGPLTDAGRLRLAQVAEMAREATQTMRDLVWVVDQRSDDSVHLFEKLQETAARLLGDLPFTSEVPAGQKSVQISPEQKRHVLLFVKEALHNILRHAAASSVVLRIQSSSTSWCIQIEDNGCGFCLDQPGGSQLDKLYARARRLHGELAIQTQPGAGTRLTLSISHRFPAA
jgi:signal transduction histidine kinase